MALDQSESELLLGRTARTSDPRWVCWYLPGFGLCDDHLHLQAMAPFGLRIRVQDVWCH